ncbi:sporulation kinase D [bacterium BMS3Abin03]|nr:sporulation kinase D [bacterium BMS3Abin03]
MNNKTQDITQSLNLNLWYVRLRWIACFVAFVLVIITVKVFHYLEDGNLLPLLLLVGILAGTNIVYLYFIKKEIFTKHLKEMQIVTDLLILTFMLHYSGGIENPLSFVYLFHVILSGILLEKRKSYLVVALSILLFTSLAICELTNLVPHYTLDIFPHKDTEHPSIQVQPGKEHAVVEEETLHAAHYPPYVWSITSLNLFLMLLTAYFITNIMERLRSEERKTNEERQRLEHVLTATHAGLVILNKNQEIVWYNEPVKSLLGLETIENSQLSKTIFNLIDKEESPALKTFQDGIIRSVEGEKIDENGQRQYFQVTVAPLLDANNNIYQVVELIQDISDKKILEAEMLHAAKMVTLGTMAAGIAHEVGNPLASISTRLQLLESQRDRSFIAQSVKLLQQEIRRIERIVKGISQFGRTSKEGWGLCQVNQILTETLEIIKYHDAAKSCNIETNFSPDLSDVLGVCDQLKQVFLNLGLNALEAMPHGGNLLINSYAEKGNLIVQFVDTGIGIKKEELERIFQPFYTTKQKGSGLGLFIVNQFILAHSGKIDIDSEPGKGTGITISLPVHRPKRLQKNNSRIS